MNCTGDAVDVYWGHLIHYYFSPVVNHIFFLFSSLGGETYFESVCMGANLGAMAFHGQHYRRKFGKLGIVVLAGKPNVGKSKEIMTALHCSSSLQYFFAKVDIEINFLLDPATTPVKVYLGSQS